MRGKTYPDFVIELRRACWKHALPRLVEIVDQGEDRDSLEAIKTMLAYSYGKPKEQIELDITSNGEGLQNYGQLTIAELRAIARGEKLDALPSDPTPIAELGGFDGAIP